MKISFKLVATLALVLVPCTLFAQKGALEAQRAAVKRAANINKSPTGYVNGHKWVDLGLSVNWADMNVFAESVEDPGGYFAWGEVNLKPVCTEENSLTMRMGNMSSISGDENFDAARANMGGKWRLPTYAEWQELIENCEFGEVVINDVVCLEVTGPNGNSIYLPAAGEYDDVVVFLNKKGRYWTATPDETDGAYYLDFDFEDGGHVFVSDSYRYDGQSVRGVIDSYNCK